MLSTTEELPATPIAYTIVESPVPAPACVHDDCETKVYGTTAIVTCNDCPRHWVVRVEAA